MGLFDLPAPLLAWMDGRLALVLPDVARLVLWAGLSAAASMGVYMLVSPQARLAALKQHLAARRQVVFDAQSSGDDGRLKREAKAMVLTALAQVGVTLPPTLLAAVPILCTLAWASNSFSYQMPSPSAEVAATVYQTGGTTTSNRLHWPPRPVDLGVAPYAAGPDAGPAVPVLHKRAWWNVLFGNPLGYLPANGAVERVEFALAPRRFLPALPGWLAGWEIPFLVTTLAVSLLMKCALRLH